jgi:hypothetical protein
MTPPVTTIRYPGSVDGPYPRLPGPVLRDLVGVCRCLHRTWTTRGEPPERVAELERIGKTLRAALEASRLLPGVLAHIEAWEPAEAAVARLGELLAAESASGLLEATAGLVKRRPG